MADTPQVKAKIPMKKKCDYFNELIVIMQRYIPKMCTIPQQIVKDCLLEHMTAPLPDDYVKDVDHHFEQTVICDAASAVDNLLNMPKMDYWDSRRETISDFLTANWDQLYKQIH